MENATKAIYIVASTLLALILLALMVYVFSKASRVGLEYDVSQSEQTVEAFNTKFQIFETTENVASDVVSAVNLAYSINKMNYFDIVNYVDVFIYLKDSMAGNADYSLINSSQYAQKNIMFKGGTASNNFITTNDFLKLKMSDSPLKTLNDVKFDDTTGKMIYRYYFTGIAEYNMNNGKINKFTFTMQENTSF